MIRIPQLEGVGSADAWRSLFEHASVAMLLIDDSARYVAANARAVDLVGVPRGDILGRPFGTFIRSSPARLSAFWARLEAHGEAHGEVAVDRPDGTVVHIDYSVRASVLPGLHLAIARDVTERVELQARLAEREIEYRSIFDASPVGLATVVSDFRFRSVNQALCRMLGYTEAELLGMTFVDITHPDDIDLDVPLARRLFEGDLPSYRIDKRYITKAGHEIWIQLTASVVRAADGGIRYGLAVIEDIAARKQTELDLRREAFHDPLTGLANRVLFTDRLEHAVRRRPDGLSVAVAFLDLDGFKRLNDTLGHAAGDEVLRLTAERIRRNLRPEDTAARIGGDEFAVLLEDVADARIPALVVARIQAAIAEPALVEGRRIAIEASAGVIAGKVGRTDAEFLLAEADRLMYEQKRVRRVRPRRGLEESRPITHDEEPR